MDGRDFGPPRSVHGPPPPLLSGLAMDSHRVGAATAGRLPASGLPGPLPPGKYMAGLNLHPHPGKCSASCQPPLAPTQPHVQGREAPEIILGLFPSVRDDGAAPPSRPVHGVASSLGSRGGETPGPGAEAGREVPAERGALLGCLPRLAGFSAVCGNWSRQGRLQPPSPCG